MMEVKRAEAIRGEDIPLNSPPNPSRTIVCRSTSKLLLKFPVCKRTWFFSFPKKGKKRKGGRKRKEEERRKRKRKKEEETGWNRKEDG